MPNMTIFITLIIPIIAGSIWLQVFLSKKRNKWLGLIIPLICFMFSMMTIFSLVMFTNMEVTGITQTIDGVVVTEQTLPVQSAKPSIIAMIITAIPAFLISNIPTVLFLAIYFACREKLKLRNELDKMNVQDLE